MRPGAPRERAGRPFVVRLGEWRRRVGDRLAVAMDAPAGDLADELATSSVRVPPSEPVGLEAVVEIVSGGVVVSGTARTRFTGECRRCLRETTGPLEASFTELCVPEPDDDSTYRVDASELDLEPIVHDACILELPLAPLCSPECRGLCPVCGADRNTEPCECRPAPDGRWAALAELDERARAGGGGGTGE